MYAHITWVLHIHQFVVSGMVNIRIFCLRNSVGELIIRGQLKRLHSHQVDACGLIQSCPAYMWHQTEHR